MKKWTALSLFALVAACGTTDLPSPEVSAVQTGQKGIVRTYNMPLLASIAFDAPETAQILSIDDRKVNSPLLTLDEKIAVDVGRHVVEVACVDRSGYNPKDFTEIVILDVKPHHEYRISCSFDHRFGPNGTYLGAVHVKEKPLS